MNKTMLLALTSALALGSAALAGGGNTAPRSGAAPANCQTIAALVAADPNFSTLGAALNVANLTAILSGPGPFTVFAPTNAAFAKLPTADLQALVNDTPTLTKVLQYHVVSGKVAAAQAMKISSANTLAGAAVAISMPSAGTLMINNATVVRPDVKACNGVIHVIDTVLLPPGLPLPSATATTDTTAATTDTTATTADASAATTATASALPAAISVTQIPVQPLSAGGTVTGATTDTGATSTDTTTTTTSGALPAAISVSQIPVQPLNGAAATTTGTTATDTGTASTDTTATDTTTTDTGGATDTTATGTDATTTGTTTDTTGTATDTSAATTEGTTDTGASGAGTSTDATATTTDTGAATTTTTDTATTAQGAATTTDATTQANSISKVVAADPRLSTFLAALKAANLETAFDSPGDYTVFAPTNDAFAKIPQAQLDALLADPEALFEVLNYHVVAGRYSAAQVATLQNPQTLEGDPLTITAGGGGATVNGAALVATDLQANNGVIHLVDTVLLPPNFQLPAPSSAASAPTDASGAAATGTATTATGTTGAAASTTTTATGTATPATTTATSPATGTQTIAAIVSTDPNFSTLYTALQAAGLVDTLGGTGPFTVFAPTNAAFAKLPAADLQALLADKERLTRVLNYHVVPGLQTASAIGGQSTLTTAAGTTLPVTLEGSAGSGNLRVGGALVTRSDVTASNGVIQVIDTVLMPPQ